jgi:hypothetical protein
MRVEEYELLEPAKTASRIEAGFYLIYLLRMDVPLDGLATRGTRPYELLRVNA